MRIAILGSWPSLSDIEKDLKIDPNSNDLANVSTSALLIPSYANLTDQGYAFSLPSSARAGRRLTL